MKITVSDNLNPVDVIRRAGYGQAPTKEPSYSRRFGDNTYPRFHVYISGNVLNLHLDQKQASYEGFSAHGGEYDGEVVEREADRIAEVMQKLAVERSAPAAVEPEKSGGFWGKMFGK